LIHLSTPLHQEFHFFFFLKKRIPFLPWDFRDFFLARFLVGACEAGEGKAAQQKLRSLSAGFLSPLSLYPRPPLPLCFVVERPTCLSSLSSPLPTPPVLLFPGKKKKEIFWCKIRSAVAALLHRDLLLSWPVWLGGLLEWHGFLFLGCCSS